MKTRTLLLLALGCGLAIMAAGAVFLFQLAAQDELDEPVPIGKVAGVADMSIVVVESSERAGVLTVAVELGGVADDDGAAGFRLIASGRPITVLDAGPGDCLVTEVTVEPCTVRFDVSSADGVSRVLFYERGDEQARWVLG